MFPKNSLVPSLSSAVASSPGLCTQLKNTVWSWRDTEDYSAHQKGSKGGVYLCWGSGEERVAVLPGQADEDITKQTSELDLRSWSQKFTRWRVGSVGRRQSECLHRHEQWESTACGCMWLCREAGVLQSMKVSCECMLLGSLSRHNKNLEWRTLKPPGGSQLSEDRPCYRS